MTDFLDSKEKEDILMGFTLETMLGGVESTREIRQNKFLLLLLKYT